MHGPAQASLQPQFGTREKIARPTQPIKEFQGHKAQETCNPCQIRSKALLKTVGPNKPSLYSKYALEDTLFILDLAVCLMLFGNGNEIQRDFNLPGP